MKDDYSVFNPEPGGAYPWSGDSNERPDQIDWLLGELQNRWNRGYRRIVLHMPAGAPVCQKFAQAQWWPMAQWRRNWFEAEGSPSNYTEGVKGWILRHKPLAAVDNPLEVAVYVGWWIGNPCTICTEYRPEVEGNCVNETHPCPPGPEPEGLWMACPPGYTAREPRTTEQDDLKIVWQNIQPWREIGLKRFWIDNSSHSYNNSVYKYEWREFVNNPNWEEIVDPPILPRPIFGGEAFPTGLLGAVWPGRYEPEWHEFDFSPWVIDLAWAERACQNGAPCDNLTENSAHQWSLSNLAPLGVREAAIFFSHWPRCSTVAERCGDNGAPHPHWDLYRDPDTPEYFPFQRLENLYEWYICRHFCFWQGDITAGSVSGPAERIFGFGQIVPPGDFDGDGDDHTGTGLNNTDWWAFDRQYKKWNKYNGTVRYAGCFNSELHQLTYYHGDMNSDGEVDQDDKTLAEQVIRDGAWTDPERFWLGEGGPFQPNASHTMTWSPNYAPGLPQGKWLLCDTCSGPSSAFGPP